MISPAPSLASCLTLALVVTKVFAGPLEKRACANNNLLRGLSNTKYQPAAVNYCSSYNSVPAVTVTSTGAPLVLATTTTTYIPNTSVVSTTETDTAAPITSTVQTTTTVAATNEATQTQYTYTVISTSDTYTYTLYSTTTTVTTTLATAPSVAKRSVAIPPGLASILSSYSPFSISSACSCVFPSISKSTKTVAVTPTVQTTSTVTSTGSPTSFVTSTTYVTPTTTATSVSTSIILTTTTTNTRSYTNVNYVSFTSISTIYTQTATACLYSASPVANPSFEDPSSHVWAFSNAAGSYGLVEITNTVGHTGSSSAHIQYNNIGSDSAVYQNMPSLCPGQTYIVSVWAKATDISNCQIGMRLGYAGVIISLTSTDWTQYTARLTYGGNPALYLVMYCSYEGGTRDYYFDDASVVTA